MSADETLKALMGVLVGLLACMLFFRTLRHTYFELVGGTAFYQKYLKALLCSTVLFVVLLVALTLAAISVHNMSLIFPQRVDVVVWVICGYLLLIQLTAGLLLERHSART